MPGTPRPALLPHWEDALSMLESTYVVGLGFKGVSDGAAED